MHYLQFCIIAMISVHYAVAASLFIKPSTLSQKNILFANVPYRSNEPYNGHLKKKLFNKAISLPFPFIN